MNDSWNTLMIFSSVSLLALCIAIIVYEVVFRYRRTFQKRVKQLSSDIQDPVDAPLFRDLSNSQTSNIFNGATPRKRLQSLIDQSGLAWTTSGVLLGSLVLSVLAAVVMAFASPIACPMAALVGLLAPLTILFLRRSHRTRQLTQQLPETFQMISRAVRAGQTVPSALKLIAEEFDAPVSDEFALCYEQEHLGVSRATAFRNLAARSDVMELRIFVVALLVQSRSGGDLVEMLDNLAKMVEKRLRFQGRVRALTGEGRMQANVLLILPAAALAAILFLSPDYAKILLERPGLLIGTAAVQLVGAFWAYRIVNFKY